jgi:hypothetical protein
MKGILDTNCALFFCLRPVSENKLPYMHLLFLLILEVPL